FVAHHACRRARISRRCTAADLRNHGESTRQKGCGGAAPTIVRRRHPPSIPVLSTWLSKTRPVSPDGGQPASLLLCEHKLIGRMFMPHDIIFKDVPALRRIP